jgi:hypothetical protein
MRKVPEAQLTALRQNLFEDSQTNLNYIFMTITACLIATGGLSTFSLHLAQGAFLLYLTNLLGRFLLHTPNWAPRTHLS